MAEYGISFPFMNVSFTEINQEINNSKRLVVYDVLWGAGSLAAVPGYREPGAVIYCCEKESQKKWMIVIEANRTGNTDSF